MRHCYAVTTLNDQGAEVIRDALLGADVFSTVHPLDIETVAMQVAALLSAYPEEQRAGIRQSLDRAISDALNDLQRPPEAMTPQQRIARSIEDMQLNYGRLHTWRSGRRLKEAEVTLTMPWQLRQAVTMTRSESWRRITLEELELLLMPQLESIPVEVYCQLLGESALQDTPGRFLPLIELACADRA